MVNMIHLMQLGIIHRDNMYNRAACLSKEGKKGSSCTSCTYISERLISPLSGCIPDESSQLSQGAPSELGHRRRF